MPKKTSHNSYTPRELSKGEKRARIVFIAVLVIAFLILCYIYRDEVREILADYIPGFSDSSETSTEPESSSEKQAPEGEIPTVEVHFPELGNKYTGDCTYIRVGDVDILIDAGSRQDSAEAISAYLNQYITDGVIEYVIVTHAHQDHIAGFVSTKSRQSIFARYECKNIIDFPRTDATSTLYQNYVTERDKEVAAGANHYTAAELIADKKDVIVLGNETNLKILDSYYYYNKSSTENNYSVCVLLTQGDLHYLFTGDLEEKGEEYLVQMNDLPEVDLFKAGHHGSYTASSAALLSVIKPKKVAVCCCCGTVEYTKDNNNTFPAQAFCDRIAPYTKEVYITSLAVVTEKEGTLSLSGVVSMNGNLKFTGENGVVSVLCSASSEPLYRSEWFKTHRTCPPSWREED